MGHDDTSESAMRQSSHFGVGGRGRVGGGPGQGGKLEAGIVILLFDGRCRAAGSI